MKTFLKVVFVLIVLAAVFVGIDLGASFLRKKAPIIHWSNDIENGKVDHTLVFDIYYCYNLGELTTTEWVSKKTDYKCPESDILLEEENVNIYYYKGFFNKKKYIKKITNNEELKAAVKYIKPFNKKYDDAFFEKRNILIVFVPTGENAVVKFDHITVSSNIRVKLNIETARADRENTSGYAFFIEVDKEYLGEKDLVIES